MVTFCLEDKMKNKVNYIILILIPILVGIFFALVLFNLIPFVHNSLLILGFFLLATLCLIFGNIFWNIKVNKKAIKIFKIIFLALYYGLLALGLYFYIILGVLSSKSGEKVTYKNETYYIIDESFFDPFYIIYKKTGPITMKSFGQSYYSIPELTEENIEKLILGTYKEEGTSHEETVDKTKEENVQEVEESVQEPQAREEKEALFKSLDPEDLIKIPDSPYVLGMVDKALGSSYFYYFGRIDQGKIAYISDLAGYPAYKEGKVNGDIIDLVFIDSNGKTYNYQSIDGGKNFEEIQAEEDQ